MKKWICDLCGTETDGFDINRKLTYAMTKDSGRGMLVMVAVEVTQGDLCSACVKRVVAEGKTGLSR